MVKGRRTRYTTIVSVNGTEECFLSPKRKNKTMRGSLRKSNRNTKIGGSLTIKDYFERTKRLPKFLPSVKNDTNNSVNNIFLNEPVLTLNIQTTANKVPVIKKSFTQTEDNHSSLFSDISNGIVSIGIIENITKTAIDEHIESNSQCKSLSESFSIDLTSPTRSTITTTKKPKPTTPHRILCPSPEKLLKTSDIPIKHNDDNILSTRTRKKLDIKSRENGTTSPDLSSSALTQSDKKQVLNITANPPARQNTKNNKKFDKQCEIINNKTLTDYFPIRRSVRKTKKEVQQELIRSYEKAILEKSENGLEVKDFGEKGRGVVTLRSFEKGEFVLEYIGELISISEANKRESQYSTDDNTGCYMYYFKHSGQQYCIDATEETGKLGRLVNHSRTGNLTTKTVVVNKKPHLVLIAKNEIKPGDELTYDYGDRSKESLIYHPWLAY